MWMVYYFWIIIARNPFLQNSEQMMKSAWVGGSRIIRSVSGILICPFWVGQNWVVNTPIAWFFRFRWNSGISITRGSSKGAIRQTCGHLGLWFVAYFTFIAYTILNYKWGSFLVVWDLQTFCFWIYYNSYGTRLITISFSYPKVNWGSANAFFLVCAPLIYLFFRSLFTHTEFCMVFEQTFIVCHI